MWSTGAVPFHGPCAGRWTTNHRGNSPQLCNLNKKPPKGIMVKILAPCKQEGEIFTLFQEAYIANLVRLHGLDTDVSAGLPCPEEWIQDDEEAFEEENYDSLELVMAQKVTGECLWVAYRTRPDILYVTNYMAAMTTKRPVKVYRVGLKVMSYLNATAGLKLKVEATAETEAAATTETKTTTATTETKTTTATTETKTTTATAETVETQVARHYAGFKVDLSGYSDASYAPHAGKSFGCSLVMIGKTPVTWKAGKQPIVSTSVCEAELLEGSNCALLVQSTEAMLREILPATSTPSYCISTTKRQATCSMGQLEAGVPGIYAFATPMCWIV